MNPLQKASTAFALSLGMATAAAANPAATLDQAHRAYHEGEFGRSLQMYEQLAGAGNAEAAERAGFMLFHGSASYGRQVRHDPGRAMALLTQAARAGRPGAGFLLNLIDQSN
ncbi:hypothetical protein FN976_08480 [Caenimonas sedimenti]|uniref:Sel1 repeat family protein n=1 Tax=Caenimonas sedimenti TaxID=2596921 RepID=A0A562ZSS4_9BURK|nr:hypothetical protein [Caenimonas sedimenti]TWO71642.1 hypothetical protein FN976_08480 [Caenimonas sedimenti]